MVGGVEEGHSGPFANSGRMRDLWRVSRSWLSIIGLLLLAVAATPACVWWWAGTLHHPFFVLRDSYEGRQITAAAWVLAIWAAGSALFLLVKGGSWRQLWQGHPGYWLFSLVAGLLFMLSSNPVFAGRLQWLRVLLPVCELVLLGKLFHLKVVKAEPGSRWMRLRPVATAMATTLALGLMLEGVFMFVAKTSLNDNSLASKIWFARHWQLNASGCRDAELPADTGRTGQRLIFIGDSFLAGHGVKDTSDRFSNLLKGRLGAGWQVFNFGQNGANAESLEMQLQGYHAGADLVVLCWFVNDIQGCGDPFDPRTPKSPSAGLQPPGPFSIVHGSYFINYMAQLFPSHGHGEAYLAYLQKLYAYPDALAEHNAWMQRIHKGAQSKGARFAVVLFPMLNAVDASEFAVAPMRAFWANRHVPCLDLSPVFRPYQPREIIVNAQDAHPNPFAHKLAADAIWKFLNENHLLDRAIPQPAAPPDF